VTIEANFRTNWRCADFLAEANLENGNADVLLTSLRRSFAFLSAAHQQQFLRDIRRSA
jgi:hypothetical protein